MRGILPKSRGLLMVFVMSYLYLFHHFSDFIFLNWFPLDSYTSTKPSDWKAVLGEHHLVDKEVFEQSREIESIYLHPKYKSMFLEGIYDTPPDYDVGKSYDTYGSHTLLTTGIKEPVIIYPGEGSENFACIIVKFSWSPLRLCCILMTLMTPALHWQSIFYSPLFILCQGWLFSPLFLVETMRSPQSLPEHPPEYISFPFYFSTIVYSQERLKDHRWPKTFLMMTC